VSGATNDQLTWSVEGTIAVPVVRLRGHLTGATVALVRIALLKGLTDQPAALVVDVGGLACADPLWLSVLAAVSREASDWPGSELILCGADTALARLLDGVGTRHIPRYATREDALRAARLHPVPRLVRLRLEPTTDAPAQARFVAVRAFWRWGVAPDVILAAEVVVSELVTNAVVHARTTADMGLRLGDRFLHIGVRDGAIAGPVKKTGDPNLAHGHGLRIVAQLASGWGSHPAADGKTVWATFRLPEGRPVTSRG
jgi:anti-anti-sigma regulatory factor